MFINKIKKMSKGRYKIIFENDDNLILYEDVIIKYNLLTKKNIDEALLNQILKDNYYYNIYDNALRYINIRMRSKKEITNYLLKKYNDHNVVNEVVDRLLKEHYIDDVKFCQSFVNDKLYLSNDGIDKIRQTLLSHDIKEDVIDKILNNIDSNIIKDKLYKLMEKYIRINKKYSKNQLENKILNYFTNIGYSKDMILEVYSSFDIKEDSSIIKKEYEKLLKKYSKKYTGYKLESFLKSKLYQRGFSIEEINSIVKEEN